MTYMFDIFVIEFLKFCYRDVLFEFHLKFWNSASNGIPVRSLRYGRQTSNWSSCSTRRNNCSMVFKENISSHIVFLHK